MYVVCIVLSPIIAVLILLHGVNDHMHAWCSDHEWQLFAVCAHVWSCSDPVTKGAQSDGQE